MILRCRHKIADKLCNNMIGVKERDTLVVQKNGRTVRVILTERATEITCEKCGGITRIYADTK